MSKIIATCGHEIKNVSYAIEYPDVDRIGEDCISCIMVCPKCFRWYRRNFELQNIDRIDWRKVGVQVGL